MMRPGSGGVAEGIVHAPLSAQHVWTSAAKAKAMKIQNIRLMGL